MHKYKQAACRTIAGALIVAIVAMATYPAKAEPVYVDGALTIAAGATSATADIALTATAITITRIVVANAGAVTTGVSFAAADLGVLTKIDAFALAATSASSSTNVVAIPVRDLRVTVGKATNATDVVIKYRIFGTAK